MNYNVVRNGDLAIVIDHSSGKYVFAVVGDRGNPGKFNEVSMSVAWDLGYTWADGSSGPSGNFETIIFPNTAAKWSSVDSLVSNLNDWGQRHYR